jgi:hypothetical protein
MPTIPLYKIARGGLSTVKRVEADLGPRVSDEAIDKLGRALESAAGIAFIDENGGGPRLCRCCRIIDSAAAGACREGVRNARVVGIRSRMRFRIGSPRARSCA